MEQRPEQPPEGKLIHDAADHMNLSIRAAARQAGISYGRWRQIVMGYQNVSPGSFAPVHAPARTLARMAAVVGVTADQMETQGHRPDAAEFMRQDARPAPLADPAGAPQAGPAPPERVIGMIADAAPAEDVAPFLEQVRNELADATRKHGPGHTGAQAFTNPDEAGIWDNPRFGPEAKERMIAAFRLWAAEGKAEREARTGLVRYIAAAHNDPVTTAIRTLVSVGGKALRASV